MKSEFEIIYPFTTDRFLQSWDMWKQFKKEQFRFSYKGIISEQAALIRLSELAHNNEETAIQIINQSISNGWRGLFELKQNGTTKQQSAINTNQEQRDRIISGTL